MKTLSVRFKEMPGEEIVVRLSPVPTVDLLNIAELIAKLRLSRQSVRAMATAFAPYVVSWSYPEPVGVDGLLARDFNVLYATVNAWIGGVRDAPRPLPLRSSDGEPSEAPLAS